MNGAGNAHSVLEKTFTALWAYQVSPAY